MIKVTCSKCGRVTEAADNMAGQTLYCAGCQSPLRIAHDSDPTAGAVAPAGNPLRMAGPYRSASGGRMCSHCGALMAEGDVICTTCGYDPKTGDSSAARFQRQQVRNRKIRLGVMLIVLAVVAAAAWMVYRSPVNRKTLTNVFQPGKSPEPQVRKLNPDEIQKMRTIMEAEISRKYPMFELNQKIEIELATGRVIRGTLLKLGPNQELSVNDEDQIQRLFHFSDLRELFRIRVDPEFRKQYIEKQVSIRTAPRPVPPAP